MNSPIRSPGDFWAGIIYIAFAAVAIIGARDYGIGSALKMGPGYFPIVLGCLLGSIGFVSLIRSLRTEGFKVSRLNLRSIALIAGPIILFALIVRGAGVLIALPVLVIISSYASAQFNFRRTMLLALGLTLFCTVVFIRGLSFIPGIEHVPILKHFTGLGIPLPLLGSWFGG